MSDAMGRLHIHLHSRSVLKLWKDEEWTQLTPHKFLKADKVLEAELLAMAKAKPTNHDNSKGDDEDDAFEDILTARRAIQILEEGPEKGMWNDRGHQRLLRMASNSISSFGSGGGSNSTFSGVILR